VKETSGIQLVDRSMYLARSRLGQHLWIYYAGTVPCLLYFIYFFNDMSTHPVAGERLGISSGVLALLFVWMKVGHSLFGLRAYETLMETRPRKIPPVQIMSGVLWQTLLGAAGLIVLPIALIMTVPFGWCYAFFQNATAGLFFGDKGVIGDAVFHASYGQRQNHLMLWIVCPVSLLVMCCTSIAVPPLMRFFGDGSHLAVLMGVSAGALALITLAFNPFGGILFVNFAATMFILPRLLEMFFGWETLYSMSYHTFLHPGFIMTVWALCFLCMDPIVKICYVVRMYDRNAVRSGHDLLKRTVQIVPLIFCILFLLPSGMKAAPFRIDQTALDKTISEVLQNPVYAWRENSAFEVPERIVKKTGIMHRFFAGVKKTAVKILHKIARVVKKLLKNGHKPEHPKKPVVPFLFDPRVIMIGALLIIAAVMLFMIMNRRKKPAASGKGGEKKPDQVEPALAVISPSDHPPDGWETMAGRSLAKGDARAAIRFFFLSTLSLLGERRVISLRTSRSNREHRRELNRRFPDQEELNGSFFAVITTFEYTWFGTVVPAQEMVEKVISSHRYIKEFIYRHA
jgi:hypothetical protein